LKRLLLLFGPVGVRGEVNHLDLEGAGLLEFLDSCLDTQLKKINLARQAGAEMVIDALHVGRDLHLQRGSDSGELEVIEHAHRRSFLFEGFAQNCCSLRAQLKTECRRVISVQRWNAGTEDVFDGVKASLWRGSGSGASSALQIQRDALHSALVERHGSQTRLFGNGGQP
jgi:hypothetical protein